MYRNRRIFAIGLGMLLAVSTLLPLKQAEAQSGYPNNGAHYTPAMILSPVTLTAVNDNATALLNDIGSTLVRVTGTFTGLTAVAEVTSDRLPATQTWNAVSVATSGASRTATISGTGLYRVDTTGYASVRIRVTAISSGSAVVAMSGGTASQDNVVFSPRRATYNASVVALAPAASATDFFTLTGSATRTVVVNRVSCTGISTANATANVVALTRSTANSAGTATNPTAVRVDTTDPAATAVVAAYTANPTLGTLVGNLRAAHLTTTTLATSSVIALPLVFDFTNLRSSNGLTLRGASQVFALNGNAASFTAGAALNCSIEWTEE